MDEHRLGLRAASGDKEPYLFERDNTDFLLSEGLPLLSTFRLIESPTVRQAIYEIVKRAAGVHGPLL